MNCKRFEMKWSWSNWVTILACDWSDWGKPRKPLNSWCQPRIWIKHLPKTSQEHYNKANMQANIHVLSQECVKYRNFSRNETIVEHTFQPHDQIISVTVILFQFMLVTLIPGCQFHRQDLVLFAWILEHKTNTYEVRKSTSFRHTWSYSLWCTSCCLLHSGY